MCKTELISYIENAIHNLKNDYEDSYIGKELLKLLSIVKNENKYSGMANILIIEKLFKDESSLSYSEIRYLITVYNNSLK